MENLVETFIALGGLHDATMLSLHWHAESRRLEIEIEDIEVNTRGFPGYKGPTRATVVFSQVTGFKADFDFCVPGLSVYDWKLRQHGNAGFSSEILVRPGGKMLIECGEMELRRA